MWHELLLLLLHALTCMLRLMQLSNALYANCTLCLANASSCSLEEYSHGMQESLCIDSIYRSLPFSVCVTDLIIATALIGFKTRKQQQLITNSYILHGEEFILTNDYIRKKNSQNIQQNIMSSIFLLISLLTIHLCTELKLIDLKLIYQPAKNLLCLSYACYFVHVSTKHDL